MNVSPFLPVEWLAVDLCRAGAAEGVVDARAGVAVNFRWHVHSTNQLFVSILSHDASPYSMWNTGWTEIKIASSLLSTCRTT